MSKKNNEGFLSPLSISRRFPLSELLLRQAILPEGGVGGHAWNLLSHYSSVGTYFCGSLEKSEKLEPAKISCHTLYALVTVIRVVRVSRNFRR